MKIKNKFSASDRVEVIVDNIHLFQEIVCLVDSPKFIRESKLIKERLGIHEPIIDIDKNFTDLFSHWEHEYCKWCSKNESQAKTIETWAIKILRKFGCPSRLRDVVIQAVLLNMAISYSGIIEILNKDTQHATTRIAILPTPHTTNNEIKEALIEAKRLMQTLPSIYKVEGSKDTTPNIKQYRNWYWQHILGMTYQQIADEHGKQKNINIGYEDVAKAISAYQKMLV